MPKGQHSPDPQERGAAGATPRTEELAIGASGAELRSASEWLEAVCGRNDVPQALSEHLALCLNEVVANVIAHGGQSALGAPVGIKFEVRDKSEGAEAGVTVSDAGVAFDPRSVPQKPSAASLDEATPGGLGLVMVRRCAHWLDYRHEGGRNHFTFGVRWNPNSTGNSRFRRGPDRRVANVLPAQERRRGDRRTREIEWVPLFRNAGQRELSEALADCEVLLLSAGETLLRAGEANRNVFVLLSGTLVAHLEAEAGADAAIDIEILSGECIGELSAIDGKPISAQVLAATDARVLRLDREVFWGRVMRLPGVAENLMVTLTGRMRRANEKALVLQREQLELKHLRKELEVARQLQASMLPLQRPLFPGRADVEVCGLMEPASKVGGDLFDAFFVDDRSLFIAIGDVSGHGIAAALFMVRVIGLLRTLAMETTQPDKLLETLNDRLCIGNDANLFVTLFCGFLDVPAGRFVYANGGHCAPIVIARGKAAFMPLPKGILVGAASGRHYARMEYELAIGETLICYTDGVTEAENKAGEPFAELRCLDALRGGSETPLSELLDALHVKVTAHAGSVVLADDCTMLAVRRLAAG